MASGRSDRAASLEDSRVGGTQRGGALVNGSVSGIDGRSVHVDAWMAYV